MAVNILRGPAGSGKSQWFEQNSSAGDLFLDVTTIWAALRNLERDGNGLYPVRLSREAALTLALYLKAVGIRFAAENGINGWATTSNSSPLAVERIRERIISGGGAGAVGRVVTVGENLSREEILDRLRDPATGEVSEECQKAVARWFGRRT